MESELKKKNSENSIMEFSPPIGQEQVSSSCDSANINIDRKNVTNVNCPKKPPLSRGRKRLCKLPIECAICGYKCRVKGAMETHMRVHSGEKPFECSICGHRFSQKSGLKVHLLIHSGEKPFQCTMCSFKCTAKLSLQAHTRIHLRKSK